MVIDDFDWEQYGRVAMNSIMRFIASKFCNTGNQKSQLQLMTEWNHLIR
jgi:hypothetical protein